MFKQQGAFEAGIAALQATDPLLAEYVRHTRTWSRTPGRKPQRHRTHGMDAGAREVRAYRHGRHCRGTRDIRSTGNRVRQICARPPVLLRLAGNGQPSLREYACHEANYSFRGIMRGARVMEAETLGRADQQ